MPTKHRAIAMVYASSLMWWENKSVKKNSTEPVKIRTIQTDLSPCTYLFILSSLSKIEHLTLNGYTYWIIIKSFRKKIYLYKYIDIVLPPPLRGTKGGTHVVCSWSVQQIGFQPNGKVSSYNIISLYALSENFFKNWPQDLNLFK